MGKAKAQAALGDGETNATDGAQKLGSGGVGWRGEGVADSAEDEGIVGATGRGEDVGIVHALEVGGGAARTVADEMHPGLGGVGEGCVVVDVIVQVATVVKRKEERHSALTEGGRDGVGGANESAEDGVGEGARRERRVMCGEPGKEAGKMEREAVSRAMQPPLSLGVTPARSWRSRRKKERALQAVGVLRSTTWPSSA